MDLFEKATRAKYRFPSVKGDLTVENLFDLPLQSKSGFDLDSVAKGINGALKATEEESFVSTKSNPRRTELADKLEIVKHVITSRINESEAEKSAIARKEQREKLMNILGRKEEEKLAAMSVEEIKAQLASI